jgi:predicted DNA-binding transcriptional regulator YafY
VLAKVQVDIDYAKPGQSPERRRVHPYGLVDKSNVWYLLAGTDRGRRTFRLSRVGGVWPTDEPVEVPDGFDLASEWETSQREYAAQLRVVEVELDVAEDAVLWLTARLGGWSSLAEQAGAPARWRRFTLSVPHVRVAVDELARFGGAIRVRSPEEVRSELARIGAELVATNA